MHMGHYPYRIFDFYDLFHLVVRELRQIRELVQQLYYVENGVSIVIIFDNVNHLST